MVPVYQDPRETKKIKTDGIPFYILYHVKDRSPLHHHDFAELSLVVGGSGTETINGRKHPMQRGTVSFLLPHHIHEIRSDPSFPLRLYSCMFDLAILFSSPHEKELLEDLLKSGQEIPSYTQFNEEQTLRLETIMSTMMQEYENANYGRDIIIRAKLLEALTMTVRSHKLRQKPKTPEELSSHPSIWDVVKYVHMNYNEPLQLNDLAARFNTSPSTISKLFKKLVGKTFTDYLHSLRICRAESLLAFTGMSVTEIAVEVGFEHFRTFGRVFKERKGVSPKQYRETCGFTARK